MNFFQVLSQNFIGYFIYTIYSLIVVHYSIILSKKFNVIDYPKTKRKIHKTPTPLIGFFYFLLTFFIILIWLLYSHNLSYKLIFSFIFGLLFNSFVGLIDDKSSLTANSRIVIFIIIFSVSISLNDTFLIQTVRSDLIDSKIILSFSFAFTFTILCYLLLLNSLNLSDGINGLAILIAIIWLSIISIFSSKLFQLINFLLVINLLILLVFNLKSKIFLGSSGINFVATYICFITVFSFNFSSNFMYEHIFLLFMIPGVDMMRVFFMRILSGKNPFTPDKNHFHHLLIKRYDLFKSLLVYFSLMLIPILFFLLQKNYVIYLILGEFILYCLIIKRLSSK